MSKLWFKAKRYGYGWYPSTWEGWLVILIYCVLLFIPMFFIEENMEDATFVTYFVPYVLVLSVILIWISAKKGEKAKWRWGGK